MMNKRELLFDNKDLLELCVNIFNSIGVQSDISEHVSQSLISTSLAGIDSHGVILIPRYVHSINKEIIKPNANPKIIKNNGALSIVSGERGFGQISATYGMNLAIKKAREHGIGVVGLCNTNHVGRVGEYALIASKKNFISLCMTNASAQVAPYGSKSKLFGTNPITMSAPTGDKFPILVDLSTSIIPEGKVKAHRNAGEELPPGLMIDKNGIPTIKPKDLYEGGALLPIGGYKGSALSLMVEILGGILTGSGSPAFQDWQGGNGVLFIVIDPNLLCGISVFQEEIKHLKNSIKNLPNIPEVNEVFVPGDPEYLTAEYRNKRGIPIDHGTWEKISKIADNLSIITPKCIN